jgi:hypothetical protein
MNGNIKELFLFVDNSTSFQCTELLVCSTFTGSGKKIFSK